MELAREEISLLDRSGECFPVFTDCGDIRLFGAGCVVRVHEIDERTVRHILKEPAFLLKMNTVPSDLRDLAAVLLLKPAVESREQMKSPGTRALLAPVKEELQSDTDPEEGCAARHHFRYDVPETILINLVYRIPEISDAGEHDMIGVKDHIRVPGEDHILPEIAESLQNTFNIACIIINYTNHKAYFSTGKRYGKAEKKDRVRDRCT